MERLVSLEAQTAAHGTNSVLRELRKLGEGALWQLGSGALLAAVACIILLLTKLAVWAFEHLKESLYICFVIDKNDEAHSWLNHYLAKQADGTRNELYDPTRDFDSEDGEGGYSDMDDDDDSEAGDSDEELLGSQTAGAGPTSGVLLEARGGRSKRLMSRVIPGERQVLQVEGRKVWVQRQPAVAEDEENDGGRGQHNGRRNNNNNNAKADSAIKKGAFKVTVNRHLGPETFSSILAAARSGFLSSRRGRLLTYEAVASQNNNGGGGGGYDDDNDLCWDDGGGVGMGLGAAQSSIQLAWHYAPSCRAVAPGQIIFPQGLEGTVDALVADVGTFLDSASWYAQRGIPYRRGYIIHGPAGCGKSMTAAAVATALKLPVYIVDLANPVISDEWLASLLNCVPPRSVIVFDRIDRAFDAQRKRIADPRSGRRKPSAALSFSGLLNALDGVCAFEGSVTIFTSELPPDHLDEALTRPGRCDYAVSVPQATPETAAALFSRFFRGHPRFSTSEEELARLAEELRCALEQRAERGAAAFSMRDVVSFLCTRSPQQVVAEADALGIDAAEAAARTLLLGKGGSLLAGGADSAAAAAGDGGGCSASAQEGGRTGGVTTTSSSASSSPRGN